MGLFGKRRKVRERREQIMAAVSGQMDELEAKWWELGQIAEDLGKRAVTETRPELQPDSLEWWEAIDEFGSQAVRDRYPDHPTVLGAVESLFQLCDGDVMLLMEALQSWYKAAGERFAGDEERRAHLSSTDMLITLNGVGNLFGFIPSEAPSFDAELAAAGRERGWRR